MDEKSFQELKNRSLYARLKRLFSNDIIVRNIGGKKLKVIDTDEIFYATDKNSLRDRFNRLRTTAYNQYSRDFNLSYQSSRVELFRDYDCVGPDTIIPLPDGTNPTIAELTEKYKDRPQERFLVFSYDTETDSIKLGKAYHPRKKEGGARKSWKVIFDNGQYVIGSAGHPFLMRNGEYKKLEDLSIGESVMPFYQKDFYNNGYRSIYNFSKGWQSEHVVIAEQFERPLNDNEMVHNKDFDKTNNSPSNLKIMAETDHKVVSIEYVGEIEVYDVTVEKYKNFATDSCFVHNTMDSDPILNSALDIYADECTTRNELGEIVTVRSSNDDIKSILNNLFYDILNIEFNLWSWTRSLTKYGDFYLRMHISPEYGVYMVEPLSSYYVTRVENAHLTNKNFTKFQVNLPQGNKIEDLENYQMAHFRLLSDSNFLPYGRCLVGVTHIDTEFGSKYIKDIDIGELIWTFNKDSGEFELSRVENKICSGIKSVIKIRTQHNFVECSKEHPIMVYDTTEKTFKYVTSENIKIGDLLVVNSNINKKHKEYKLKKLISEDRTCPSHKPDTDNIPEYANEEFCEFMGFMLGDGWIRKYPTNYRVCFSLGIDEDQNKRYIDLLQKYSGKEPYIAKTGNKNTKSRAAVVYSKYLYEILYNNGISNKSAKDKRIPLWIFESPLNLQHAFTIGLTNADGWSFTDKWDSTRYNISLCNRDLIYDFKKLIQFSNIKTSIPTEDDIEEQIEICGIKCTKHGEYSFYYYLDGEVKQQLKKYNFVDNSNILLEPVVTIEFTGEKETWDIQVDSENSNFIANGLIVHNSMLEGARRVWKQLCLHKNTEIWTDFGYKTIENIKNGDVVYSYDYNNCELVPSKVKNWAKTGIKDTYLVKTKHRTLQLTESHDILVIDDNKNYSYKKVKDLLTGESYSLVLPTIDSNKNSHTVKLDSSEYNVSLNTLGIEYIRQKIDKEGIINRIKVLVNGAHPYKQIHAFLMGTKSIPYSVFAMIRSQFNIDDRFIQLSIDKSKNNSVVNNKFEFEFNSELIRFMGFMIGDGWVTKNGIGFVLSPHEDINKRYIDIMKYLDLNYSISYPKNKPSHPGNVIVYSKEFKLLLESAGFISGFKNKVIPEWIFQLSIDSKKEFINGLFDADGSWKWGVIGLSNKELITQLKHLCQQSGIMCNEVKTCLDREETDEFGVTRQPTYKLYINFNKEYKLTFERIISVKLAEKNSEVYDIQVDSEFHNFVANGSVVHNSLMEDAMLIHRIMRAPEKRIFKVDIGNIPPNEVDNHMERIMQQMKKTPYLDQATGDYNLRFNLQNMVEDFFLPVRGGDSGTSIDNLPGLEWTGTDDIEYLRNKMMAALKIPKAFLGYDESLCISPDTLIPLLNGEEKSAKELIDDHNNGIKNYVYAIDEKTKNIVSGEIEWAGYTRLNAQIVRVWLDNNKFVDCTPDHNFLTRDGRWVESQNLTIGQSLMPLYLKKMAEHYDMIHHNVVRVEFLENKIDTCDITVKEYHNFATAAGVIIHNSGKATLAAEDIRFARTIQRVQRIIVSELNKIAVVHLYSQGYRDDSLVDFSLELTNPSTIFEKEKIDVWKNKVEVSKDMQEQKLFSKKWIYDNVFGMSDQDMIVLQKELIDDAKGTYRFKQIEEEGNDPALGFLKAKGEGEDEGGGGETGDTGDMGGDSEGGGAAEGDVDAIAAAAGGGPTGGAAPTAAPAGGAAGGGEAPKLTERDQTGRKKARKFPFGEDHLGTLELNSDDDLSPTHKYKRKSPLSLESMESLEVAFKSLDTQKQVLREGQAKSFMDETNLSE